MMEQKKTSSTKPTLLRKPEAHTNMNNSGNSSTYMCNDNASTSTNCPKDDSIINMWKRRENLSETVQGNGNDSNNTNVRNGILVNDNCTQDFDGESSSAKDNAMQTNSLEKMNLVSKLLANKEFTDRISCTTNLVRSDSSKGKKCSSAKIPNDMSFNDSNAKILEMPQLLSNNVNTKTLAVIPPPPPPPLPPLSFFNPIHQEAEEITIRSSNTNMVVNLKAGRAQVIKIISPVDVMLSLNIKPDIQPMNKDTDNSATTNIIDNGDANSLDSGINSELSGSTNFDCES